MCVYNPYIIIIKKFIISLDHTIGHQTRDKTRDKCSPKIVQCLFNRVHAGGRLHGGINNHGL